MHPVIPVQADSGAIGGKDSQEFIFLTPNGEDEILLCPGCGYAANAEKAEFRRQPPIASPLRYRGTRSAAVETRFRCAAAARQDQS